jgi:hypothetical protein
MTRVKLARASSVSQNGRSHCYFAELTIACLKKGNVCSSKIFSFAVSCRRNDSSRQGLELAESKKVLKSRHSNYQVLPSSVKSFRSRT